MEASTANRRRERGARLVRRAPRSSDASGAAHPFDPDRSGGHAGEDLDSALESLCQLPQHRAERQLELYVDMLRILERDLSVQREAHCMDAARGTQRNLDAVRRLTRHLCEEFGLEPPAELSSGD